jgi:hypothetical protein
VTAQRQSATEVVGDEEKGRVIECVLLAQLDPQTEFKVAVMNIIESAELNDIPGDERNKTEGVGGRGRRKQLDFKIKIS